MKPWDICKHPRCRRPVVTGRKEADVALRHCDRHTPEKLRRIQANLTTLAEIARQRRRSDWRPEKIGRVASVPLICAYKEYHLRSGRAVFLRGLCGKNAPRRYVGDRTLPRYPSRYGDPLCEDHKHLGSDPYVFPDDPSYDGPVWVREDVEERAARLEKIVRRLQ